MKDKIRELKPLNKWDYENGFYWFSPKERLNKLLAHYELYKLIIDLPGHIFELGVYKAASLIQFASFRDSLENDQSRKIVGFDIFGSFPTKGIKMKDDLAFIDKFESDGGPGLTILEIKDILLAKKLKLSHLLQG